ncbi:MULTISPECIES: energy transducer TonB [unclassified Sphingomonas]|uniref:energy transducer TonB n=1 Tax=unclassified Sphingomonas TaxID=196159 RepID=UPI0002FAC845|nr:MULTISPECIES: energy transducer TonB [unclassified Sphingomonas]KTF70192.1 hypothetical protein ATB93_05470 [Sphingomonas sp. WG]
MAYRRQPATRVAADAALLTAVTTASDLPSTRPVKVAALLQQANMAAKRGDLATAQAMFQKTGLTSRQCAFLGLKPAMRSSGNVNAAYPTEALAMGFEGWLRSEFDVSTDGKTIKPHIVVAYPAFVFDDAGMKMSHGFRFAASYRPEDGVACTASQQSVIFRSSLYAR